MSSIPTADSQDNSHVKNLWVVILLPDNAYGHNTHGNAICIDIANTCAHYLCVDDTHENVITLHNTRLDHLLTNCSTPDSTKWKRRVHRGTGVAAEDGAICLGIGLQLLFANLDIPQWKPHYSTPGRNYLASCLIDRKCPSAASLLVLSTSSEIIEHVPFKGREGTIDKDVDVPGIPYNMLHPEYKHSPTIDSRPSATSGQPNISSRNLTTEESLYLHNWLRDRDPTSIIHNEMLKGEVTTGDI